MASQRPAALLFDVNGTLFPADACATAFRRAGLPGSAVELWFARVLRDGFAAQLAGGPHVTFRQLAEHHLAALLAEHPVSPRVVGGRPTAQQAVEQVLAAWSAADLYPDAAPALRRMHAAGIKLAALTNGSADTIARGVLQKAGLEGAFTRLLDIQGAGAWKPAPDSYAFAAQQLGLPPERIMMVASHPWDVYGALQAGLQACYVRREPGEPYPAFLAHQPQLVVGSFEELAARLASE